MRQKDTAGEHLHLTSYRHWKWYWSHLPSSWPCSPGVDWPVGCLEVGRVQVQRILYPRIPESWVCVCPRAKQGLRLSLGVDVYVVCLFVCIYVQMYVYVCKNVCVCVCGVCVCAHVPCIPALVPSLSSMF